MIEADLIIIGAGPGGYSLAARQCAAGLKVVLIERDLQGGTCLNRGCIPTKCLCASAATALAFNHAAELGVNVENISLDYSKATERMKAVVDGLRADVETLTSRCQCVKGEARFCTDGTVEVNGERYTAPRIVIATGSRPALLPIPGADLAMTSDDFLKLDKLPESVVVIGGGVIGLEFASIMNAFGVEVTVVEYCKEVLPPFDKEIAKRLRTMLSRRGIKFVTGAAVTEISKAGENLLKVTFQGKKGLETVETPAVLMSVGRKPVVPEGLSEAGIDVNPRGFIITNDHMETTRPGVFAVGDCNGRMMLAHVAEAQAAVAMGTDTNLSVIPSAVFTSPEAAMAGLTEEAAIAAGYNTGTAKAMFAGNGKARAMDEAEGLVKVVYDKDSRKLLGCHIVGPHAADLVAETVTAMVANLTVDDVAHRIVHGHPTLSEVVSAACAAAK